MRRIEEFEAAHQADLADDDKCFVGDPTVLRGLDPHPGGQTPTGRTASENRW
ncbi:hypothetical protein [Streptomyces dysideae]|uniref:hypothetical protein n=1 Tax=Streptomyces dysideae TaxID=909626 RepID=UPI000A760FE4|nr:hypothetical protein [Streptomyces dysideae]